MKIVDSSTESTSKMQADAVDKAINHNLLKKGEETIHVRIDADERTISVHDNATGIPQNQVMAILRNIAHSTKKRGEDKGFRGIGRLGGLGYCSKLIFETSYYGEPVKSVMTWDADLLKYIINDRENSEEATDVLSKVTKVEIEKESIDAHYFNVIMEDVSQMIYLMWKVSLITCPWLLLLTSHLLSSSVKR